MRHATGTAAAASAGRSRRMPAPVVPIRVSARRPYHCFDGTECCTPSFWRTVRRATATAGYARWRSPPNRGARARSPQCWGDPLGTTDRASDIGPVCHPCRALATGDLGGSSARPCWRRQWRRTSSGRRPVPCRRSRSWKSEPASRAGAAAPRVRGVGLGFCVRPCRYRRDLRTGSRSHSAGRGRPDRAGDGGTEFPAPGSRRRGRPLRRARPLRTHRPPRPAGAPDHRVPCRPGVVGPVRTAPADGVRAGRA
jgi:hypothetical protein